MTPVSPAISSRPEQQFFASDGSLVKRAVIVFLALYVFIIYSRALEFANIGVIPLVMFAVVMIMALFGGDLSRVIREPTTRWLLAYIAWTAIAVIFSTWRGGSTQIFTDRIVRSFGIYFAIVALVNTPKSLRVIIWAVGAGCFFIGIMSLLEARDLTGRLIAGYGTFADPNALSMYALFGIPFLLLVARKSPLLLKAVPWACAALALYIFGKAGSRGGIVALLAMVGYHFLRSSMMSKLKLAGAATIALALSFVLLPQYVLQRYLTFFSVSGDSQYSALLEGNDVGSTISREELAGQAYRLTLEHPLTGVGPGNFANEIYREYKEGGDKFINHSTHNSFLQIASETGIPGFVLLVGAVLSCLFSKAGRSFLRPWPKSDEGTGDEDVIYYARLGIIGIVVFMFSLSFGYDDILMLAMGLMVASVEVAKRTAALREAPSPAPQRFGLGTVRSAGISRGVTPVPILDSENAVPVGVPSRNGGVRRRLRG